MSSGLDTGLKEVDFPNCWSVVLKGDRPQESENERGFSARDVF
jgi:hypothetical protein